MNVVILPVSKDETVALKPGFDFRESWTRPPWEREEMRQRCGTNQFAGLAGLAAAQQQQMNQFNPQGQMQQGGLSQIFGSGIGAAVWPLGGLFDNATKRE